MTDERAVITVPDERGVPRATRLDELTWRPSASAIVLRGTEILLLPYPDVVAPHLPTAVISAVNASEVHQKLAQYGVDADRTLSRLRTLGLAVEPVGLEDALAASRLWASTRSAGLSLGDRCCLALAVRLGLPAVTADGSWSALDLGVDVVSIRDGT